ncbi:MAG: peptide chain release factor N(5)-glutamine methyltransferase [Spirochaetota bacterium]
MSSTPRFALPPRSRRTRDLLTWATGRLKACLAGAPAGSAETPYLDALLLLGLATGQPTERLMASLPDEAGEAEVERFTEYVNRRCEGIPVSYIRGKKEFFGREFVVSPAVLVPRPDTETLVEITLGTVDKPATEGVETLHVHDVCTGSGCIPITLAAERPRLIVSGSDIDESALDVARTNRERIVGPDRVHFWRSDLAGSLQVECDRRSLPLPTILTANPPYLTDTEYEGMRDAGWPEPPHALKGGPDGLDVVRRLAREAVTVLPFGGYLVLEVGPDQGASGIEILTKWGFSRASVHHDLAGRDRVIVGVKEDAR